MTPGAGLKNQFKLAIVNKLSVFIEVILYIGIKPNWCSVNFSSLWPEKYINIQQKPLSECLAAIAMLTCLSSVTLTSMRLTPSISHNVTFSTEGCFNTSRTTPPSPPPTTKTCKCQTNEPWCGIRYFWMWACHCLPENCFVWILVSQHAVFQIRFWYNRPL